MAGKEIEAAPGEDALRTAGALTAEKAATTHTPGPWVVELIDKSGVALIKGPRMDGDVNGHGVGTIADIDCSTVEARDAIMFPALSDESLANARLIAAAPEMYEALKGLRDLILDTPDFRNPDKAERMRAADAALASAEPK